MKPDQKSYNSKQDMKRFHNEKRCPCVITHLLEDNSSEHAEGV